MNPFDVIVVGLGAMGGAAADHLAQRGQRGLGLDRYRPPQGVLVQGATASAKQHHLMYEILSAEDIRGRFPAFHPEEEMVAVWEPRAGVLFVEKCIEA